MPGTIDQATPAASQASISSSSRPKTVGIAGLQADDLGAGRGHARRSARRCRPARSSGRSPPCRRRSAAPRAGRARGSRARRGGRGSPRRPCRAPCAPSASGAPGRPGRRRRRRHGRARGGPRGGRAGRCASARATPPRRPRPAAAGPVAVVEVGPEVAAAAAHRQRLGRGAEAPADARASRPSAGGSRSSRSALIARASTGAAPSVPMATTTGSRSTMAGVMNWLASRLSTTLTSAPSARAIAAVRASSAASSVAA